MSAICLCYSSFSQQTETKIIFELFYRSGY